MLSAVYLLVMAAQAQTSFERASAVLGTNCVRCHGGDTVMAEFDLTTEAAFRKGGKSGEAKTKLLEYVSSGKMPLGGRKLSDSDIAVLESWIRAGAEWPRGASLKPGTKQDFWAFRSPVKVAPPANEPHPIDAFVLAKLAEKKLTSAGRASEAKLIRRLSFDLTGLPPDPADYKLGYAQAVDKYLNSPHYGERWARHWLDVVRYGETDGGEHNRERFHAWRYRDYVIDALNSDKPYNTFVREQLLGDLMDKNDPKLSAASGFLSAGPWDQVQAEINKDKIMAMTQRMDELDDMVTTTFHTFQALTVNCARCHDHKFDPIPARDYYKLTSVFQGVGFGTRKVATGDAIAEYDRLAKPVQQRINEVKSKLADVEDPVRSKLLRANYEAFDKEREKEMQRIPINPIFNRNRFAMVKAAKFRLVIAAVKKGKFARVQNLQLKPTGPHLENWTAPAEATVDKPVIVGLGGGSANELVWWTDGDRGGTDGMISVYRLEASDDGSQWRTVCSNVDHVRDVELDLPRVEDDELVAALRPEKRDERKRLSEDLWNLSLELKKVPEVPQLYGVKSVKPVKSYLLDRGSVSKPTDEVHPGALVTIRQLQGDFALPDGADDNQRRRALAEWIASEKNPLTARVIVNRVWFNHFGRGLVNTPSDFGLNGDRPSHPELLDWLAVSFMENGWSLKWLHRLILSSKTYQQDSTMNAAAHAVDADNRLYWRMPMRRMDAETIHDSLLWASGKLDLRRGGPGYVQQARTPRSAYVYMALDNDGPEVWRRSIYRFVVRGGERIMTDSFDCPDPSVATPMRIVSNTPVQALTLLNNAFVLRQSGYVAERVAKEAGPDGSKQIAKMYELLLGRTPSAREVETGRAFVEKNSLALFARAIFNLNEFVYVP